MSPAGGDREHLVSTAFTRLADTLVDEYDVIDLLDRLVGYSLDLLAVEAAGIVLGDVRGTLRVVAASNDDAQLMELLQLQNDEGPCLECYRTATAVSVPDLTGVVGRWPRFTAAVDVQRVFRSVHALPLRLRQESIGALNLSAAGRARCPRPTCPWDRPWPTWRRSGSCRNARSAVARW
jgi:GAF domain-containing protein